MVNTDQPIYLGLAGGAATGKTTTADGLAPMAQFMSLDDEDPVFWTHLFFAMPLYRMAAIRQKVVGVDAFDRQCYELHEALNDLFKGYITYEETVDTVFELASMECPQEGKPRTFLQKAGTEICRTFDPDCFPKWIERKTREEFGQFTVEWEKLNETRLLQWDPTSLDPKPEYKSRHFGVVISDTRFKNECAFIKKQTNGFLVKFTVRPEVAQERLYNRDGVYMTDEQLNHASEKGLLEVPDDWFDAIIDTSDMTKKEQIQATKEIVYKELSA
jgi:hypothetical protein